MVAQWYHLRLETRETRVLPLGKQSSHDYTIDVQVPATSPAMLTFATKTLSTVANRQNKGAVSS